MNHTTYKMSEGELQVYLESLSECELKDFQLADKEFEIARWKNRLVFAIFNIILLIALALRIYQFFPVSTGICTSVAVLGFAVLAIRSYNYMKSEILQYKMLQGFFEQNGL